MQFGITALVFFLNTLYRLHSSDTIVQFIRLWQLNLGLWIPNCTHNHLNIFTNLIWGFSRCQVRPSQACLVYTLIEAKSKQSPSPNTAVFNYHNNFECTCVIDGPWMMDRREDVSPETEKAYHFSWSSWIHFINRWAAKFKM